MYLQKRLTSKKLVGVGNASDGYRSRSRLNKSRNMNMVNNMEEIVNSEGCFLCTRVYIVLFDFIR